VAAISAAHAMECPSCGHPSSSGAGFCGECGARLADVLACPACGTPHRGGQKFCEACGRRLSQAGPAAPPARVPAAFGGGRFRVQRLLGEGGRKRVYLACDELLDRDVAFALIRTEGLDEADRLRIEREARAMARLGDHPHVVTVFDIGEEGGEPYIVSQYMAGGDLRGLLDTADDGRLPLDQAMRIADQVCQALEHIHAHGFVHRDVKPGNIWFTADGTVKLGDFGVTMAFDQSRLTETGMVVGTVAYMAPEQALGTGVDARCDLYALGATLYEMVTGRAPFRGDSSVAVITQHIETAPVAPSWHNAELPSALEGLILRLLAKVPEQRPDSAAAVRAALVAISSAPTGPADRRALEALSPLDRLESGVFVGRERELGELRAGLDDALSGRGRLMVLVGEAGIGKTRIADEFATYARLRGAQVLWGRCYDAEAAPALWAWTQVIRSYVHDRDPATVAAEMGSGAADIAAVVSEVRELVPGLPAPQPLDPEQERFRLFESIATFLRNATGRQPLVLILDDLHRVDESSLALLTFLVHELRGSRLLVVGAYREESLGRRQALAPALAELAGDPACSKMLLRGLAEHEVARFVELSAGSEPPAGMVTAIHDQTAGHPFYVNELVRVLVADGRLDHPDHPDAWTLTIPQGVRELVFRRLDHLSEQTNRVLAVASVIGRDFELATLERVADLPDDRLLEALDEARAARVIEEAPGAAGRYSFSHGLVQEALQAELTSTRRVQLHRRIAEALEWLHRARPDPHLAELAHHFFEGLAGGDVAKAVAYARRAAERASAMLAYEQAAAHYGRALEALQRLETAEDAERCEMTLALANAQARAGRAVAARESFMAAAGIARLAGLLDELVRAALGFAAVAAGRVAFGKVDTVLVEMLEEAVSALGDQDSALRARVMARLAQALYWSDSRGRRVSLGDLAVDMARRLDDTATLAYTLNARRTALWDCESIEDRLAAGKEIVGLAERAGDAELMLQGRLDRIVDLLELGEIEAADAEIEIHSRLAEELRDPVGLWHDAVWKAMRALLDGRFEEAEGLADRALAIGAPIRGRTAEQYHWTQTFWIRREQGRLAEIAPAQWSRFQSRRAAIAELRHQQREVVDLPTWRMGMAFAYSELGREEDARRELDQAATPGLAGGRKDLNWLLTAAQLSEVCANLDDHDRAAQLYEVLLPYASRCLIAGRGVVCLGSIAQWLGLLCAVTSRREEGEAHFEAALDRNARIGARPWLAHTQRQYAEMLLARGEPEDREKAADLLGRAVDIGSELGMKLLLEKVADLQARAQAAGGS
jgi:tetratricopeptide (TPR) repeat protein